MKKKEVVRRFYYIERGNERFAVELSYLGSNERIAEEKLKRAYKITDDEIVAKGERNEWEVPTNFFDARPPYKR